MHLPIGEAQMFSGPCDLLVVFTKSLHTRATIRTAAPLLGSSGIAMTVQNGLGNAEAIAQVVPEDRIVVGMTTWPADIRAAGHVVSHGSGEVRIWSMTREPSDVVFKIARSLSCAGLNCIADPDVESAIWEKLAFNAALNSLCAASGLTVGSIGQSETGRRLAGAIASETLAVARALSIKVNKDRVQKALDHAFLSHRDHKPSMLQDLLAGRVTEIEAINGAVVDRANAVGLEAPATGVMADLVRLLQSARRQ